MASAKCSSQKHKDLSLIPKSHEQTSTLRSMGTQIDIYDILR